MPNCKSHVCFSSVFEAFSFLLDDGNGQAVRQQTMKAFHQNATKMKTMSENNVLAQKLREEFARFERTMEELYLLKRVAADLKSYRKMIRLKRYD